MIDPNDENQAEQIVDRLKYSSNSNFILDKFAKIMQEEIDKEIMLEIMEEILKGIK